METGKRDFYFPEVEGEQYCLKQFLAEEEPPEGDGGASGERERGGEAPGNETQQDAAGEGDAHLTTVLNTVILFFSDQFVNGKVATEVGKIRADLLLRIVKGNSGNSDVRLNPHAIILMAFDEGYLLLERFNQSPHVTRLLGHHS